MKGIFPDGEYLKIWHKNLRKQKQLKSCYQKRQYNSKNWDKNMLYIIFSCTKRWTVFTLVKIIISENICNNIADFRLK